MMYNTQCNTNTHNNISDKIIWMKKHHRSTYPMIQTRNDCNKKIMSKDTRSSHYNTVISLEILHESETL